MRSISGVVCGMLGLFLLVGPGFGSAALLSGREVYVDGGLARVGFDLIAGVSLVVVGRRLLRRRAPAVQ
ncbi:MAG: hypothetical protein ACOYXM_06135 [Actinomycetota bacterium]